MINFELFNEKSKILINESQNKAIEKNHQQVNPEHFLLEAINQGDEYLNNLFKQCGTDLLKLSEELETIIKTFPSFVILFKYMTGLESIAPTIYDPENIAKPSAPPLFEETGLTGLVPSVASSVPK